jgi:hypothetical protein
MRLGPGDCARVREMWLGLLCGAAVLRLALVVVLVVLLLQALPAAQGGGQPTRPTTPPPCAQHFPPTCKEASRGR